VTAATIAITVAMSVSRAIAVPAQANVREFCGRPRVLLGVHRAGQDRAQQLVLLFERFAQLRGVVRRAGARRRGRGG
jgi:hypothetical protein